MIKKKISGQVKDIAVITINYNSSSYTLQCVQSVIEQTKGDVDYSIVVVDNHSIESEFRKLKPLEAIKQVHLVQMGENAGYAVANMTGVGKVAARYYYFLNNDTILVNDVLTILHGFMEDNQRAGICSGQMYLRSGIPGINFNYFPDLKLKMLGSGLLRIFNPDSYPSKKVLYNHPIKVPLLNGSSLFVRSRPFHKAGGFDTNFFLYCEEEDLALRMKELKQYCYLVPEAKYVHYEGKSSIRVKGINFNMIREFYISQHYLYLKHYGRTAAIIWRITQFFRSFRKFYIHKGYVALALFILRGPEFEQSLRNVSKNPDNQASTVVG